MKKTLLLLVTLSAMAISSCHKEEEVIETNSRGVPMSIADIIMGDNYDIDTLYKSGEKCYILIDNPDYTQHIIYTDQQVIANSPAITIDSIAPGVYEISDYVRSAKVNFANQQSVDRLLNTFPQYEDFPVLAVSDTSKIGQKAFFGYAVSVPSSKIKNHTKMVRWIEGCISDTMAYNENIRNFGKELEKAFFSDWQKKESDYPYINSRSLLAYDVSPKYVTYNDFFWGFMGGAHGMTCNRYVTYLTEQDTPLTAENLLQPDSEDAVRELIYEAITADEDFMQTHKITSLSQARTYIQRFLNGEQLPIPSPGLLREGVVFCYQPYDIAPYSDGIFTLVIPYEKIAPYLAPGIL